MATDTQEEIAAVAVGAHDDGHIEHPTPKQYWLIALALAVITAIEIAVPSIEALDGAPSVFLLLALGALKFGMVAALFMHLRFDKPLYRNFFLIGLAGAIGMFIVVLLTFRAL
jgi:caa(3)-type oxidase subunit IV